MDSNFNQTVGSLFQGMDTLLSTKTVVGEPTQIGDTIILPLVDVNFGVAAGAFSKKEKGSNNAGGGMGGKMSPSAVLVIQNGHAKMVSTKSEDNVSKIIGMVPDVIDKISSLLGKKDEDEEQAVEEAIKNESEKEMDI